MSFSKPPKNSYFLAIFRHSHVFNKEKNRLFFTEPQQNTYQKIALAISFRMVQVRTLRLQTTKFWQLGAGKTPDFWVISLESTELCCLLPDSHQKKNYSNRTINHEDIGQPQTANKWARLSNPNPNPWPRTLTMKKYYDFFKFFLCFYTISSVFENSSQSPKFWPRTLTMTKYDSFLIFFVFYTISRVFENSTQSPKSAATRHNDRLTTKRIMVLVSHL